MKEMQIINPYTFVKYHMIDLSSCIKEDEMEVLFSCIGKIGFKEMTNTLLKDNNLLARAIIVGGLITCINRLPKVNLI